MIFVPGHILDCNRVPICGAVLDVWHSDDNGYYDLQNDFTATESSLGFRAKFMTDEAGRWSLRTLPVKSYTLPLDGPVGGLVSALKQHSNLPAHVHFIITAKGYKPLITQLFPCPTDPFLVDSAGFSVKPELIKTGIPVPNTDEVIFEHDFILVAGNDTCDMDPLHYVPPASAALFFSRNS